MQRRERVLRKEEGGVGGRYPVAPWWVKLLATALKRCPPPFPYPQQPTLSQYHFSHEAAGLTNSSDVLHPRM